LGAVRRLRWQAQCFVPRFWAIPHFTPPQARAARGTEVTSRRCPCERSRSGSSIRDAGSNGNSPAREANPSVGTNSHSASHARGPRAGSVFAASPASPLNGRRGAFSVAGRDATNAPHLVERCACRSCSEGVGYHHLHLLWGLTQRGPLVRYFCRDGSAHRWLAVCVCRRGR